MIQYNIIDICQNKHVTNNECLLFFKTKNLFFWKALDLKTKQENEGGFVSERQ